MVGVLKGEAEDEDRDRHDRRRKPDDDEAGFGFDVTRVPALVVVADEVMQPVAEDCADGSADNRSEVEEAWRRLGSEGLILVFA